MTKFDFSSLSRRTFLKGAAASLPIAAGLGPLPASAQDAALRVGLLRNPVSGLIEVAAKKGWFQEAGVSLETTLFTGAAGPKVIQAMGSGSLDLSTVSATAAILALANGAVPLKIISIATDPAPLFMLLSKPEIESVEGLAGKKVATPQGTGLQYYLARALQKHGMSMDDIEYVNLGGADAQSAFLAGQVDAVVPPLIGAFIIQQVKPDTRQLFMHGDFTKGTGSTEPFVDYDVFIVPESVAAERKDDLRAFLTAYHDNAVPYLTDAATQEQAIEEITAYVNNEQKSPIDAGIVRELMLQSGFFNRSEAKALVGADDFAAGLDDQIGSSLIPVSFRAPGRWRGRSSPTFSDQSDDSRAVQPARLPILQTVQVDAYPSNAPTPY
jgi:ABC-type nitrate/sulfonate/bicarbonate transport system substrate-binding protein